jgi:hypothetical protein
MVNPINLIQTSPFVGLIGFGVSLLLLPLSWAFMLIPIFISLSVKSTLFWHRTGILENCAGTSKQIPKTEWTLRKPPKKGGSNVNSPAAEKGEGADGTSGAKGVDGGAVTDSSGEEGGE